jgi:ribosome-associated translation inhibitor RaiA
MNDAGDNMKIVITARHFTPSIELKCFIEDKLIKLLKYDSNIDFVKVVLLKESRAEKVELILTSKQNRYITKCYSSIFEKTIIKAISNIKIQIGKKLIHKTENPIKSELM